MWTNTHIPVEGVTHGHSVHAKVLKYSKSNGQATGTHGPLASKD